MEEEGKKGWGRIIIDCTVLDGESIWNVKGKKGTQGESTELLDIWCVWLFQKECSGGPDWGTERGNWLL